MAFNSWSEVFEPEVQIDYFSPKAGSGTLTIKNNAGVELNRMDITADKGFNHAMYDLTISEKGKKDLEKQDSSVRLNAMLNGSYYLPKGDYVVRVEIGGNSSETTLTIN